MGHQFQTLWRDCAPFRVSVALFLTGILVILT